MRISSIIPLMILCVAAAAPLMATTRNEPRTSEARAGLGTIKDRLRVEFMRNGNNLDPNWKLEDLVARQELQGKYYDAKSYGFFVRSAESRAACIYALAARGPQIVMEVSDVNTGAATITSPGDLPDHLVSKEDRLRHERVVREMNETGFLHSLSFAALLLPVPLVLFVILAPLTLFLRRRRQALDVIKTCCILAIVFFVFVLIQPVDSGDTVLTGPVGLLVIFSGPVLCCGLAVVCWKLMHVQPAPG